MTILPLAIHTYISCSFYLNPVVLCLEPMRRALISTGGTADAGQIRPVPRAGGPERRALALYLPSVARV
jgi:hypothetical protein